MLLQVKHRFATQDYHRIAETGVLKPDARVELLDGEIIDMSPIGPLHGGIVNQLADLFQGMSNRRYVVTVQNPLPLDQFSEPLPDLMLLKPRTDFYRSRHPLPSDVLLLIEVSDTTLVYDREVKIPGYGRAGIQEVWLVNLEDSTIETYRKPGISGFASTETTVPGRKVAPLAFPDICIDVRELFHPSA